MSEDLGTRARLVAATRDAIRDIGLSSTTSREITTRASANLAAITYHFGSKDALVADALIAEVTELLEPVWLLLDAERPAIERATAAATTLADLFDEASPQVPAYLAALSTVPHSAEVAGALSTLWGDLRHRLAADIDAQLGAGTLPGWVDPDAMAALILAVVNGVIVASAVDPNGPDHRDVAGQFVALLIGAALTATAPEAP